MKKFKDQGSSTVTHRARKMAQAMKMGRTMMLKMSKATKKKVMTRVVMRMLWKKKTLNLSDKMTLKP